MSNPKGRTVPEVLNVYLIMLGIYCLDLFFLKSDLSILGDNFYSRFVSFVVLFIIIFFKKTSIDVLGISKNKKKIATGVVYGIIFSVIPIFIATGVECAFYAITDASAIHLSFSPPSLNYVKSTENITPTVAVIIYAFSTLFSSAFKEVFFRGFVLKKLKSVMDFKSANFIQALLYMSLIAPLLLRNLINHYYDDTTTQLGIFIVVFYIVHETLAGIKWGLLTRVNGTTYTAIVDHFLYVFLANSIYITNRYVTWSFMTHMLAIQLVSLAMVYVYYRISMKKLLAKKALKEAEEAKRHEEKKAKIARGDYSDVVDKKLQSIDAISPDQYKGIVAETTKPKHSGRHHSSKTNNRHSEKNVGKIESFDPTQVSKLADEYLDTRLSTSHHHHSSDNSLSEDENKDKIEAFTGDVSHHESSRPQHVHHHHSSDNSLIEDENKDKIEAFTGDVSHHESSRPQHVHHHHSDLSKIDAANADKIEGFSPDEIEKKAAQYSDSLSIERATPRHPHPHDKMAIDALTPVDEIEKSNADKMESFNDGAIDEFLENFNKKLSTSKTHKTHYNEQNTDDIDDVDENFNADEFLNKFQNQQERKNTAIPQQTHHHHHHHSSSSYRDENDIASLDEVSTDTFFDEYNKAQEEAKPQKHHRRSFMQTVRDLGEIDDSASNDLI